MTRRSFPTALVALCGVLLILVSSAGPVTGGPPPATSVALDDAATCEGGSDAVVRVSVDTDGAALEALDIAHLFDDDNLAVIGIFRTPITQADYVVFSNVLEDAGPDTLDLAMFTGNPQTPGPGEEVLWLVFRSTGAAGTYPLTLNASETQINEQAVATLVDGSVTVGAADVRLAIEDSASGAPSSIVYVPMYAAPTDDLNSFDLEVFFNPLVIQAIGAQTTAATSGFTLTTNLLTPGRALISLFSPTPLAPSSEVAIVEIAFQVVGMLGDATALDVASGVTDDGVSTCLDDGWFEICPDEDEDGITACSDDPDDCDDSDPLNSPPLVGDSLILAKSPVNVADLTWDDEGVPGPFRLYRGFRDTETPFDYNHTCLGLAIPGASVSDTDVPLRERLFYYLISREGVCGESGLGFASDSTPRPNDDPCMSVGVDADGDGFDEAIDNCPGLPNPTQADGDGDGNGDDCDNCVSAYNPSQGDLDEDGEGNACDPDDDGDGVLDGVDNCPLSVNPLQEDTDSDGVGDACDSCPLDDTGNQHDFDLDGVGDGCDNCPDDYNPGQEDGDSDDIGDVCDPMP